MTQYWVAIHHPDNYDPSVETNAMAHDIDVLNEELEAAVSGFSLMASPRPVMRGRCGRSRMVRCSSPTGRSSGRRNTQAVFGYWRLLTWTRHWCGAQTCRRRSGDSRGAPVPRSPERGSLQHACVGSLRSKPGIRAADNRTMSYGLGHSKQGVGEQGGADAIHLYNALSPHCAFTALPICSKLFAGDLATNGSHP